MQKTGKTDTFSIICGDRCLLPQMFIYIIRKTNTSTYFFSSINLLLINSKIFMIEQIGLPKSLNVYSRFLDHVFEICLRINAVCNKNIFTLHVYFVKELKNKK